MTEVTVGTVDVYVIRQYVGVLQALVLHRAPGVRCAGAWEAIHGRIEAGERPEDSALRETAEETGFVVQRLYNVRCHAFYLPQLARVNVAVVFAAFVESDASYRLSAEHDAAEWLDLPAAAERYSWPRSREVLRDIAQLYRDGDAGPLEDVLRVR